MQWDFRCVSFSLSKYTLCSDDINFVNILLFETGSDSTSNIFMLYYPVRETRKVCKNVLPAGKSIRKLAEIGEFRVPGACGDQSSVQSTPRRHCTSS